MELFLLGFNLLLVMAVWNFMLRKTILDLHRDQLFDLRDQLRADFIRNGWGLESKSYERLRSLINGYLRFTEDYALFPFTWLNAKVRERDDLQQALKEKMEHEFSATDEEMAKYIKEFRSKSLSIMMNYMVTSNWPLLILSLLFTPIVTIIEIIRVASRGARRRLH